ncbi:peptidylprolyl isomerase [Clostridium sartagoforme]|uniref:peptidylprolyl isomerase n=1 Tax=Clostridium sartagoforme TaxID=84031 RepID=A0A4S2DHC4_9CLOT|nr:peptidylprolyl isomerase [Clostridium sartagoforme]TGY40361.1 peptidylprolyl isomerase [Clostridium sartagoforme]
MIRIKKLIAVGALSIFAFSAVGCEMIQRTPESIKKTVLAKVGDLKVTRGEVDEIADPYLSRYGEDYETNPDLAEQVKELRTQALNLLVEQKMMLKKAEELGLEPTQEEIDAGVTEYIEGLKEQLGGEEAFTKALEDIDLTLEEYTAKLNESIKVNLSTNKVTEEIFKDINTTDDELKTYYDEHLDSFREANVSHILIKDEAKAKEIRERAVNGEDFAALAKEFSEDPGTKENGGSLGVTTYDTTKYVTEFTEGFKKLKEGEISDLVKSTHGYHIIKVTDYKEKSFDESKETIKSTLENEEKNEIYTTTIEQWKKDLKVKTYEKRL